ncbi:Mitogen-activated protein kinase kinase kinase 2 [Diplonema papillatum]|nr:Mitogen-activated protein kinase kinase kinase 2 [Diplonema papillatum]
MAAQRQSTKMEPQMPKSISELGKLTNATAKKFIDKMKYASDPVLSGIRNKATTTATSVADGLHLSNRNMGRSGKAATFAEANDDFGPEGIIEDPDCDPTSGWARMPHSTPGTFVKAAGQVWTYNGQTLLIVTSRSSSDRDKLGIHAMKADTGVWQSLDYLRQPPPVRFGHSAIIAGDTLFVFGGWSRDDIYNETYCVDLVRRSKKASWTAPTFSGPVCPKRAHHSAVLLGDDTMLVFGGSSYDRWKAYSYLNDTWTLDLVNFRWQQLRTRGTPPAPRAQHTAVAFPRSDGGTDMIVFGGATSHWIMDDFFYFSMQNLTWYPIDTTAVCPYKKILSQHTEYKPPIANRPAVVYQGTLYIYGGGPTVDEPPCLYGVDLVQELDPATRLPTGNLHLRWSYMLLRFYPERWYHMLLLRPDGGLFLVGGTDNTIEGHCDKVRKRAYTSVYWLDLNRFATGGGEEEAKAEEDDEPESSSKSSSLAGSAENDEDDAGDALGAPSPTASPPPHTPEPNPPAPSSPPGLPSSAELPARQPAAASAAPPAKPAKAAKQGSPPREKPRGNLRDGSAYGGGAGGGGGNCLSVPKAAASLSSSRHLSGGGAAFTQMQSSLQKKQGSGGGREQRKQEQKQEQQRQLQQQQQQQEEEDDEEEEEEEEEEEQEREPSSDDSDDSEEGDSESEQDSSDSFKTDPGFTLSDPLGGDVVASNRGQPKQQPQKRNAPETPFPQQQRQRPEASFSAFLAPRLGRDPALTNDSSASFDTSQSPQSPALRRRSAAKKQIGAHVPVHTSKMIGKGTFGKVYLGLHPHTGEFVAVKQMKSQGLSAKDKEKIAAEIDLLRDLEHENVVGYLGTYVKDGKVNIVMEYVTGGALLGLIEQYKGGLPEIVCQRYTRQIVLGIEYLHSRRLMHRDIKPANILVDAAGICKVADFGASKHLTAATRTTMFQTTNAKTEIAGTPLYMAPEMISGMTTDLKSDVWGIGCTIVEMLDGKRPWHHLAHLEAIPLCMHIATSSGCPVMPKHVSESAKQFLALCFHRELEQRRSCTQLLQDVWIASQDDDDTTEGYPASPRSTRLAKNRRASGFEAAQHPPKAASDLSVGDDDEENESSAGRQNDDASKGKSPRNLPSKPAQDPPVKAKPDAPKEPKDAKAEGSELEKRMREMQDNMLALQAQLASQTARHQEMISQRKDERATALEQQLKLQEAKHEDQLRRLRLEYADEVKRANAVEGVSSGGATPGRGGYDLQSPANSVAPSHLSEFERSQKQDAHPVTVQYPSPTSPAPYSVRSHSPATTGTASPPRMDDQIVSPVNRKPPNFPHAPPRLPPLARPEALLPQTPSSFVASPPGDHYYDHQQHHQQQQQLLLAGSRHSLSSSPSCGEQRTQYLQQLRPDVPPEYRCAVHPFFDNYEDPEADLSDLDT